MRDYFAGEITEIPQAVHQDDHDAYNAVAERAMRAHLKKTKSNAETEEQFARRMSLTQAMECYKFMVEYILNPPKAENEKEAGQNKRAKDFLINVSQYAKPK